MLNKKYAPSYLKWLHREFYKLPLLSVEIGPIIEACYLEHDYNVVEKNLIHMVFKLIDLNNKQDELPKLSTNKNKFSRGMIDIDFQEIANTLHESISGELRQLPIDGAIDQWVTNQDFLLNSNKLKKLTKIYDNFS